MSDRLSVGVTTMCLAPLRLERTMARVWRTMGVDAIFVPDHYCGFIPRFLWRPEVIAAARWLPSSDAFLDPYVVLAMLAVTQRRVRIAAGVTDAFRRHPASLAQAAVTLDHLSRGRFILGVGNGERENLEPYGIPFTKRVARLEEAVAIIRRLWESHGEPVDFDGSFWRLRKALFATPLYNGQAPKLWVAANAPRMLQLTGRYADGWLPNQRLSAVQYHASLQRILAAAAESGRGVESFEPALMMGFSLARDQQSALSKLLTEPVSAVLAMQLAGAVWRRHGLRHPLGDACEGFADFLPEAVTSDHVEAARRQLTAALLAEGCFAGSIEHVVTEIRALVDAGLRHIVLWEFGPPHGGMTLGLMRTALLIRRLRKLRLPAPVRATEPPQSPLQPALAGPERMG